MFETLLYATMSCTDAAEILNRVKVHDDLDSVIKNELVVTIKEATPQCDWDAND